MNDKYLVRVFRKGPGSLETHIGDIECELESQAQMVNWKLKNDPLYKELAEYSVLMFDPEGQPLAVRDMEVLG